jgi:predicted PurR-regulated permease PerM
VLADAALQKRGVSPASTWEWHKVVLIAAGLFLLWQISGVLLLAFAACMLAVVLNALAKYPSDVTGLPYGLVLAVVVLVISLALLGIFVLLGVQIQSDFKFLGEKVSDAVVQALREIGIDAQSLDLGQELGSDGLAALLGGVANTTGTVATIATNALLVVVGGIFLAAHPEIYRKAVMHLLPPEMSQKVGEVLDNVGAALRHWLIGQLALMFGVGAATTAGLALVGVPSALGLGVLAGLLEFVPVAGSIIAAIPGLVVTFSGSFELGLWALGVYLAVQQIESNLAAPLVQRKTVNLPPALSLFALMAFGMWFGVLGVMVAAPLTVCIQVLVVQLYSRDMLGWKISIPGVHASRDRDAG